MPEQKAFPAQAVPRIPQPWLTIARVAWCLLAPLTTVMGILSLPGYIHGLETLTVPYPLSGWTPQTLAAALNELGLSVRFLVIFLATRNLNAMVFLTLGLLIFWRKSDTWIGLFTSYVIVGLGGITIGSGRAVLDGLPFIWKAVVDLAGASLFWPSVFLFFYLFPDGRFVPRWTIWVTPPLLIVTLWVEWVTILGRDTPIWLTIVLCVIVGVALASQVYRYRRVSGPFERQQTKWFVFALVMMFAIGTVNTSYPQFFPILIRPGGPKLVADLFSTALNSLIILLLPLSLAIALFRYRLWDIDLIIRRTLTYTLLSLLLGLVYFGAVVLLQGLFQALTGQRESPAATVLSTLTIAALFTPLRRALQSGIDRRFYRASYNAQRTLDAFSASAREVAELDPLADHLLDAVNGTVQPQHASLWIRPAGRPRV